MGAGLALLTIVLFMVRMASRAQRAASRIAAHQQDAAQTPSVRGWVHGTLQQDSSSTTHDLTLALESLRKLAEGADNQAALRTIFYLNQWLSSDPAGSVAWKADRMLDSLPRAYRNTPGLERLEKLQFSATGYAQWLDDISYLQQNLWLHDIAQ